MKKIVFVGLCFFVLGYGCKNEENNNNKVIFEQDFQEANDLLTAVREKFSEYQSNSYSVSESVQALVSYLNTLSNVSNVSVGDNFAIYFQHSSGLKISFFTTLPPNNFLFGELISSLQLEKQQKRFSLNTIARKAIIFEAQKNLSGKEDAVKNFLEIIGFDVTYYPNSDFTTFRLKKINNYQVVIIITHGAVHPINKKFHFVTGERTPSLPSEELLKSLGLNIEGVGIASYPGEKENYFAIYEDFFLENSIGFAKNSFFYMFSCSSLKNENFAKKLQSLGLSVYFGWTDDFDTGFGDVHFYYLFKFLTLGFSIEEALAKGSEEYSFYDRKEGWPSFGESIYEDFETGKTYLAKAKYFPKEAGSLKLFEKEKPSLGKIGDPCASNEDCESGKCLDSEDGFMPGGYCIIDCSNTSGCPDEAWCVFANPATKIGEGYGWCLRKCYNLSDCREGYFCAEVFGEAFGVCLRSYAFEDGECGALFVGIEKWDCDTNVGIECIKYYNDPGDIGFCKKICNPKDLICSADKTCFPYDIENVFGEKFCGICKKSESVKKLWEICDLYSLECQPGYDCVTFSDGISRCSALCDLFSPFCPAGYFCSEVKGYCGGIGICVPE